MALRGDFVEPGGERHAAPFEARQVGQRLMEDIGGQVLGRIAIADAADDEGIDAFEVRSRTARRSGRGSRCAASISCRSAASLADALNAGSAMLRFR